MAALPSEFACTRPNTTDTLVHATNDHACPFVPDRSWKRRWFFINETGVLYFFSDESDNIKGKPALGALILANASARRPTSLKDKPAKYRDTCFRLDVDPEAQAVLVSSSSMLGSSGSIKGSQEDDDKDEDEGEAETSIATADARGRTSKAKWLLAAESPEVMDAWMNAVLFWSDHKPADAELGPDELASLHRRAMQQVSDELAAEAAAAEAAAAEAAAAEAAAARAIAGVDGTAGSRAASASAAWSGPVPPASAVEAMSIVEMRQLIIAAGLSADDCDEKADYRRRAKEAVVLLGGGADDAATEDPLPLPPPVPPAPTAPPVPPEREGSSDDGTQVEGADEDGEDEVAAAPPMLASEVSLADMATEVAVLATNISERAASMALEQPPSIPEGDRAELYGWSAFALHHQLSAMGEAVGAEADKEELVAAYWTALGKQGKQHDEGTRRFLLMPSAPPPTSSEEEPSSRAAAASAAQPEVEPLVRTWVACVTGSPLPEGPLQPALRSGELLCDLINALKPGIVAKVSRAEVLAAFGESKANAKMRENIGCYVDACAELGLPQRELFTTADLFEEKDMAAVLKNLEGLSRFAHDGIDGFVGPFIGKRRQPKKRPPGGGFAQVGSAAPTVVLGGGRGLPYQAAISGGGFRY